MLQRETVTIAKTRFCFDMAITDFPAPLERLVEDAPVVRNVAFKSGMKNIQQKFCQDLLEAETASEINLQKALEHITVSSDSEALFAELSDKRFDEQENCGSKYIDLKFLLPSSSHCE